MPAVTFTHEELRALKAVLRSEAEVEWEHYEQAKRRIVEHREEPEEQQELVG